MNMNDCLRFGDLTRRAMTLQAEALLTLLPERTRAHVGTIARELIEMTAECLTDLTARDPDWFPHAVDWLRQTTDRCLQTADRCWQATDRSWKTADRSCQATDSAGRTEEPAMHAGAADRRKASGSVRRVNIG